jgi:hypothetical protein
VSRNAGSSWSTMPAEAAFLPAKTSPLSKMVVFSADGNFVVMASSFSSPSAAARRRTWFCCRCRCRCRCCCSRCCCCCCSFPMQDRIITLRRELGGKGKMDARQFSNNRRLRVTMHATTFQAGLPDTSFRPFVLSQNKSKSDHVWRRLSENPTC